MDAGGAHGRIFISRSSLPATDDCARVAHAASRRRGLSSDESDDGLLHMFLDERSGDFFGIAAAFADYHDYLCARIVVEHAHGVEEIRADDRIAANADACGLSDAELGELVHGFVSQRAAAADDADVTLLVNRTRHDSHLAEARRNNSGAIR